MGLNAGEKNFGAGMDCDDGTVLQMHEWPSAGAVAAGMDNLSRFFKVGFRGYCDKDATGRLREFDLYRNLEVSTSDANPTTIFESDSIPDASPELVVLEATIMGLESGGSGHYACYKRQATFTSDGANLTARCVDAMANDCESDVNLDVQIDVNSNRIRVRVVGLGGTNIDWEIHFKIFSTQNRILG